MEVGFEGITNLAIIAFIFMSAMTVFYLTYSPRQVTFDDDE